MDFEWDDNKANLNYKKHGVRFTEATTVWRDIYALEIPDPEHSKYEERWVRLGFSFQARLLNVIYVEKI